MALYKINEIKWSFLLLINKSLKIILLILLLSLIITYSNCDIFLLNEKQLLYIFSIDGQIIATVFGLLLTAYIFYANRLKELANEDETIEDIVDTIIKDCYKSLIEIALLTIFTIFLCLLGILVLNIDNYLIIKFIINSSIESFIITLILIVRFGVGVLDPNKTKTVAKKLKESYDNVDLRRSNKKTEISLEKFLILYNSFENILTTFVKKIIDEKPYNFDRKYIGLLQSINILKNNEIIFNKLYEEINKIRKYRNYLVHGVFNDSSEYSYISENIYNNLFEVNEKFIELKNNFDYSNLNNNRDIIKELNKGYNTIDNNKDS